MEVLVLLLIAVAAACAVGVSLSRFQRRPLAEFGTIRQVREALQNEPVHIRQEVMSRGSLSRAEWQTITGRARK